MSTTPRPDNDTAQPQGTANDTVSRIPTDREIRAAVQRGRRLQARAIAHLFGSFGK